MSKFKIKKNKIMLSEGVVELLLLKEITKKDISDFVDMHSNNEDEENEDNIKNNEEVIKERKGVVINKYSINGHNLSISSYIINLESLETIVALSDEYMF